MARPVTTADEDAKHRNKSRAELPMGVSKAALVGVTDEADAYTVEEFCRRNRISVQLFYKYPDLMPASFYVAKRRLISREAAAKWRRAREKASAADANV